MGNEGWAGGVLRRLQTAIRIMVEDSGKMSERLNRSTYPLADLAPTDFPEHLRNRATRILNLRLKYVFHAGVDSYFHGVKPRDKREFVRDLLALYEACLIDLGGSTCKAGDCDGEDTEH